MGPVTFRRTVAPSPNRRPVVDDQGRLWPSCTEAALNYGVSSSAIYSRARFAKRGWRFATADEVVATESSPRRGG
jgi:hypothetical protein